MRSFLLLLFSISCLLAASGCGEGEPEVKLLGGMAFFQEAEAFNVFAVHTGTLATQKAQEPGVAQLGRHLVTDHAYSSVLLRDLAGQKQIVLPDSMNQEQKEVRNRLGRLSGNAFDRAFVFEQVQTHQEVVALYEQASREVPDRDIQEWAQETLPRLRQHLDQARQLQALLEPL